MMGRLTRLVAAGQMTIGSVGVGARHVAKLVERVRGDISGLQVTSDEADHHALALGDYDPRTCLLEERSKGGALRSDVEERRECLFVDALETAAVAAENLVDYCHGPVSLRSALLALQTHLDRVSVVQAKLLAAAEASKAHEGTGARNSARWLAGKSNSSLGSARKKAELGEALAKSKTLDDAVSNGEVSPDSAAALHDAVTNPPEGATEDDIDSLIDCVKGADPFQTKQAADRWKEILSNETEEQAHERRYQQRSFRMSAPSDGMVMLNIALPVLEARQITASCSHIASRQGTDDGRTTEQRLADGLIEMASAYAKGQISGGRENPNLLITIPATSLTGDSDEPGCTLPPAWCQIDHLHDWILGGLTDLDNLVMWCTFHHHEKHRPGVIVLGDANDLRLQMPDGTIKHCPPKVPQNSSSSAPTQGDLFGQSPPGRPTQAAA